ERRRDPAVLGGRRRPRSIVSTRGRTTGAQQPRSGADQPVREALEGAHVALVRALGAGADARHLVLDAAHAESARALVVVALHDRDGAADVTLDGAFRLVEEAYVGAMAVGDEAVHLAHRPRCVTDVPLVGRGDLVDDAHVPRVRLLDHPNVTLVGVADDVDEVLAVGRTGGGADEDRESNDEGADGALSGHSGHCSTSSRSAAPVASTGESAVAGVVSNRRSSVA